jgi:hypothetical protein
VKLASVLLLAAVPLPGQFRVIQVTFQGSGCASCVESLPQRLGRVRGVESAALDDQKQTLIVRLAPQNRVRLEQVRDFIEQDGTKALKAVVEVTGEVSQANSKWLLKAAGLPAQYELERAGIALAPGVQKVHGEVLSLRPDSGRLVIKVSGKGVRE